MSTLAQKPYLLSDKDLVMGEQIRRYVLKVRDLPLEEKPREKLMVAGPKNLNVAELIAVILGVGTKKEEVMEMAHRIVQEYGEKAIMHEVKPQNLAEILGIPLAKACQIVASLELGRRFFEKRAGRPVFIHNAVQSYEYFRDMGYSQKEQLRGLYLNSRYEVVYDQVISIGSLTANIVHPREVFQPAIQNGAVAVIVAHNHPSGSPEPTRDDILITKQLQKAGNILGIELLDHLVVTSDKFVSIVEYGTNA